MHNKNKKQPAWAAFGADNEIRTHDLVITNDVLCQLSYISTAFNAILIIAKTAAVVNSKFQKHEICGKYNIFDTNDIFCTLSACPRICCPARAARPRLRPPRF